MGNVHITRMVTSNAPGSDAPYSQGIMAANGVPIVLSGQIALEPGKNQLITIPQNASEEERILQETVQIFKNVLAILTEARTGLPGIVHIRIAIVIDPLDPEASFHNRLGVVEKIWANMFGKSEVPPTRTVEGISALPESASVQMTVTAVIDANLAGALLGDFPPPSHPSVGQRSGEIY